MATTQLDRLGTAFGYPRLPSALGHARDVLARIAVVGFGIGLFAAIVLSATAGVIYAAPAAATVAGLGGVLVVWVLAIALIAASPAVVRRGVGAVSSTSA